MPATTEEGSLLEALDDVTDFGVRQTGWGRWAWIWVGTTDRYTAEGRTAGIALRKALRAARRDGAL